jgi:hypothetical protein
LKRAGTIKCTQLIALERFGTKLVVALALVFHCRLFLGSSVGCTVSAMAETEKQEIAETAFEQTRAEIRDAIKLEEERRAALVKNLYRLRALRLSRGRNVMRLARGGSQGARLGDNVTKGRL